jgi:hypothetical protein
VPWRSLVDYEIELGVEIGHWLRFGGLLAVIPDVGGKLPFVPNLLPHYDVFAG